MVSLSSIRTLQSIERALVEAKAKVPLNKTWRGLHDFYGVGAVEGAMLLLSATDRATLRQLVIQRCNIDLLQEGGQAMKRLAVADRMGLSQETNNEKLSGKAVASDMVLIGSASGSIILPVGDLNLPAGMLIQCHYSHLEGLERIVLVENQAVMYRLSWYQWPESVKNDVMLFRGSPQHTPAAVTQAIQSVKGVVCFPDFDPQGLMNSMTQPGCTGIIMPTSGEIDRLHSRNLNKDDTYLEQAQARHWLRTRATGFAPAITVLSREIALAQEAMTGCELEVVPWATEAIQTP